MTQNNQTSTSKQNQDKEQHARELHDKIEQEQKQNEIDKQHKQKHEEVLEAQKNGADEKSDNQQDSKASGNQQSEQKDASKMTNLILIMLINQIKDRKYQDG